ncbi:MAG TPA: hypothetical protein VK419_05345 [Bryobacteraceae bacterium]|nr:hypothetical protein [Bryobacteraceae bacterium]
MAAFTCYFDASGTQHDQFAIAVGGLMSTAETWENFREVWQARLLKSGLPYFHRKELDLKRHSGLLEDLANIAKEHSMRKFGMIVRVRELHRSVSKKELAAVHLDAYSYAGRACAAHVRIWAKKEHLRSVPRLVFATGDAGRNQLEQRLRKDGFHDVDFAPAYDQLDRKTGFVIPGAVPLQAADLLAYELFDPIRKMEERGMRHGSFGRDNLTPVWFILDKIPGEPQVTEDDSLAAFKDKVKVFSGEKDLIRLATWMPK